MPAISPARLKLQTAALASIFDQPEAFMVQLLNLLDHYADWTQRPGQSGVLNPLTPSNNVPLPVIRQIITAIQAKAEKDTEGTLRLVDILWAQPTLECRIIAALLLGKIKEKPSLVIIDRINTWLSNTSDDAMVRIVLQSGLAQVRQNEPQAVLKLAQQWLGSKQVNSQKYGLIALDTLASDPSFDNLPVIFLMITPFFRKIPVELRAILVDFINSLARRSPQETTYLLQENLLANDNPDTAWLIRHLLTASTKETEVQYKTELPEDLKQNLRQALRNKNSSSN